MSNEMSAWKTLLNGLKAVLDRVESKAVQADYSQCDPNASDYIKNRPGGYDVTEVMWQTAKYRETSVSSYWGSNGVTFIASKVSDAVVTASELSDASFGGAAGVVSRVLEAEVFEDAETIQRGLMASLPGGVKVPYVMCVKKTIKTPQWGVLSPGIYFFAVNTPGNCISSMRWYGAVTSIIPIPMKYIPSDESKADQSSVDLLNEQVLAMRYSKIPVVYLDWDDTSSCFVTSDLPDDFAPQPGWCAVFISRAASWRLGDVRIGRKTYSATTWAPRGTPDGDINMAPQTPYLLMKDNSVSLRLLCCNISYETLPNVSTSDNGKILKVVDGKWTAASADE